MAPVFANAVNSQKDCPLFTKIPQELRDRIFDLVVTPHEEKHVPYPKALRYSRPGFRHSDGKLSIALLRCCQLIYSQTCHLPAKKYVQIDCICTGENGHDTKDGNSWTRSSPTALQNLHLFTTKRWLRMTTSLAWARYTQLVATHVPNLRYLKLTLEHYNDPFEAEHDIIPNAKKRGLSRMLHTKDSDSFEGWHGPSLGERLRVSPSYLPATLFPGTLSLGENLKHVTGFHKDSVAARKRLIEAGIDFKIAEDAPEYTSDDCETYCVVTLVFEATQSAQVE